MKNSDTIRNQTRDLQVCSAVPQPTAPKNAVKQRAIDRIETAREILIETKKIT